MRDTFVTQQGHLWHPSCQVSVRASVTSCVWPAEGALFHAKPSPTQNNIHQPCTLAAFEKLFPVLTHCFMKFAESKFVDNISFMFTVDSNLYCIILSGQAYTPIWAVLSWHSLSSSLSWHFSDLRQMPQGKSWWQYSTIQPEKKCPEWTTSLQCSIYYVLSFNILRIRCYT